MVNGSKSVLSSADSIGDRGEDAEHAELRTQITTSNIGTPSSPKHASEGRDNEGAPTVFTPGSLNGEKDEASVLSTSTTEVAPSVPAINPPSRPSKFAPKQTSRLRRKKAVAPNEVQTAEQEGCQTGI